MEARKLIEALNVAEKLKDITRHCYTKNGRHESVEEHSWLMTFMVFLMRDEFLEADMDKAIDSLEALIQHNISDLSTWIPKEYELNKTYANDKVAFSEYLKEVREEVRKDTLKKIGETYDGK